MREVAGGSMHALLFAMALTSLAYALTGNEFLRADHMTNICLNLVDVRGTGGTFPVSYLNLTKDVCLLLE